MDEMSGIEFVKIIQDDENFIGIPIIFLTAKDSEISKIEGLSSGAIDYILKPFNIQSLIIKVNSIIKNQAQFKKQKIKDIKSKLFSLFDEGFDDSSHTDDYTTFCKKHNISEKEEIILSRVVSGLANKEISYELDISINTVKKRITSIFKKTDVQSRVELINKLKI